MKILLISYYFPPQSNGGTGRPYSIYKYLPKSNIYVDVITRRNTHTLNQENNIYRTKSKSLWRQTGILSEEFLYTLTSKLKHVLMENVRIKGMDELWIKRSLNIGLELTKEINYDAVYATYPNISALLVGLGIAKASNLPLISEFRDGLCYESLFEMSPDQYRVFLDIETNIALNSKAVITISPPITKYFANRYKCEAFTVYNGYDDEEVGRNYSVHKSERDSKKHRMLHFGGINTSRSRSIQPIVDALLSLSETGAITKHNFSLDFVGRYTNSEKKLLLEKKLQGIVNIKPFEDKLKLFSRIGTDYDSLLFYGVPGMHSIVSSKLVEYISLGKPILGVCRGNEAEKIILDTNTGIIVDFDKESIIQGIKSMMLGKTNYNPVEKKIRSFSRRSQSKEIASILYDVLK